ncbi:MAG: methionyl-tRNA formyltransferase [Elusimicrobiota bacterium]|jgi:methionyl-tRNA formyltransferase|nr:methionyl-tRNA formyltransferase [Elusimicrobiota bacterium]
MKTIFFGTPSVAVPFLEQLRESSQILLVVTQPDRPSGRGLRLLPCPVKKRALELGLKVISPESLAGAAQEIKNLGADLGLAVAYGKIFKQNALEATKHGILNVHFSLLPKYRGAAPVQRALFSNEQKTGVSVFWITPGLDEGPLAAQKETAIEPQDDEVTLFAKLTRDGKELLAQTLRDIEAGRIIKRPQAGTPSKAPSIDKSQTLISFKTMTAAQIHGLVRGLAGGIPAFAKAQTPQGESVQILKTALKSAPKAQNYPPGALIAIERGRGFFVQCKSDVIFIEALRPAGKKTMTAQDYINGKKAAEGVVVFT